MAILEIKKVSDFKDPENMIQEILKLNPDETDFAVNIEKILTANVSKEFLQSFETDYQKFKRFIVKPIYGLTYLTNVKKVVGFEYKFEYYTIDPNDEYSMSVWTLWSTEPIDDYCYDELWTSEAENVYLNNLKEIINPIVYAVFENEDRDLYEIYTLQRIKKIYAEESDAYSYIDSHQPPAGAYYEVVPMVVE